MRKEAPLARAIRVLECFDQRHPTLTVAELAQRAELPIATAYRLVRELVALDLIERTGDGHLRTTLRLWELGSRGSHVISLRNAALPHMEDLRRIVRQHTQLAILDGTDIVYLERLTASNSVRNIMSVAERMPARLTSSGLLLAAFATDSVLDAIIHSSIDDHWVMLATPTGASPHDASPDELRRIIAGVRQQRYARLDAWLSADTSGLSAPIRNSAGTVIAAVSLIVPNDPPTVSMCVPALRASAASISRSLGWAS